MRNVAKNRFDIRLADKQKEFFTYAANLGGFRTLTEFVIFSVQEQANQIVEKHNSILNSKKDQEIFFDSLINPPKPNAKLKKAAAWYKDVTSKKK